MPKGVKVQVLSSAPLFTVRIIRMALSTQPYKGARDFYPEDKRLQKYLFDVMRQTVEKFGYEEYDAPLLEPLELYLAKTGDEIVNDQTYAFTDRGERKIVIRPEMTPSVSRMVATRRQELAYPVRWYNIGSRWRYERPQRGRYREFFQLDVDVFGLDSLVAELEIIQVADAILQAFSAKREMYTIRLNSRKFMDFVLKDYLNLSDVEVQTLAKLIDRKDKIEPEKFAADVDVILSPSEREANKGDKLLKLLKVQSIQELPSDLGDNASIKELESLIESLNALGITNVMFEPAIMRGFDYYTDIVFEVFDNNPTNNRSMFGGGRYDGLVGLFGVEPVPSVGFAMGDATLQNFMEVHELLPKLKPETDAYVVLVGENTASSAQPILKELREAGLKIAVDYSGRKPDKQLKMADKRGLRYAIFIGEEELTANSFTLKNLKTGEEEKHGAERLVSIIKDYRKS